MRNPGGYAVIVGPDHPVVELDTFTCFHCQRIVHVKPKEDPSTLGGFCRLCFKHICGPCTDKGACDPFEAKLERMERSASLRRAIDRCT